MSEVTTSHPSEAVWRCLEGALGAMNEAIAICTVSGPAVAIEHIADYLNNTDGIDEEIVDSTPDNWLTKWTVVAESRPSSGESEA